MIDRASAAGAASWNSDARVCKQLAPVSFTIDRSDLRRYAHACGETWPPYAEGDEATLHNGARGPLLFQAAEMLLHDEDDALVAHVASRVVSFG